MQNFFYVKNGNSHVQLLFTDILYIEARNKCANVVTCKGTYAVAQPINNIERALPADLFCRIHRSFIISLLHTRSFDRGHVTLDSGKLPIGKHYKDALLNSVVVLCNDPHKQIRL